MTSFILVHSPLVGPATWSWMASELRNRRHRVVVLSLAGAAASGGWQACVDAAVRDLAVDEQAVLVGHSGAGPLLPAIAAAMEGPPSRLVFIDAGVPPMQGEAALVPDEFLDSLRALARDGTLPRWSEWFGPEAMQHLIPDTDRRTVVLAELPQLPLSYFDGRVPMPDDWEHANGAYILLSEPYRSDAAEAASRGWPVLELPGGHLDIVTRPAEVADALLDVADAGR